MRGVIPSLLHTSSQYLRVRLGLRLLACWDCDFESRTGLGNLSRVNVVRFAGTSFCDGPIPRSGESYREREKVCVCVRACVGAVIVSDQVQQ